MDKQSTTTDARTGDQITVTTPDREYTGTIVGFDIAYKKSSTVERMGRADVIRFERDDGHTMYLYAYAAEPFAPIADLYTRRERSSGMTDNGSRSIVVNDVSYEIESDAEEYDLPEDIDLATFAEPGDTIEIKLADGSVEALEVVDVVEVNNWDRIVFDEPLMLYGEPVYRNCRDLSAWEAGGSISYTDGDIAESEYDSYSVIGLRVVESDEPEPEPEIETDGGERQCWADGCTEPARVRSSYCSEACYEDDQGYTPGELLDPQGEPHARTDGGEDVHAPHASAMISDHLRLNLGQVDAYDSWPLPEGVSGATQTVTGFYDGEELDPPIVSVDVHSGMRFYDSRDDRVITFNEAIWFAHRSDPSNVSARPTDPVNARFEESTIKDDPETPRLSINGNTFARRLASGRYRRITVADDGDERLVTDGGFDDTIEGGYPDVFDFGRGCRVEHGYLGEGTVYRVNVNERTVKVRFDHHVGVIEVAPNTLTVIKDVSDSE